jgi:hypothetical protein
VLRLRPPLQGKKKRILRLILRLIKADIKALSRPFFLFFSCFAAAGKNGEKNNIKADIEALLKLVFRGLWSRGLKLLVYEALSSSTGHGRQELEPEQLKAPYTSSLRPTSVACGHKCSPSPHRYYLKEEGLGVNECLTGTNALLFLVA